MYRVAIPFFGPFFRPLSTVLVTGCLGLTALTAVGVLAPPVLANPKRTERFELASPALLEAVAAGDVAAVRAALDAGASVDAARPDHRTLLALAAEAGHEDLVRELLRRGASPSLPSRNGRTPLMRAAFHGKLSILALLVEAGVPVDETTSANNSALHYAATAGHPSVVEWLVLLGADPNRAGRYGQTPLMVAARARNVESVEFLIGKGAKLDAQDERGWTALLSAVESNNVDIVRTLLHAGASAHLGPEEISPLKLAAERGYRDVLELLLVEAGVSAEADQRAKLLEEARKAEMTRKRRLSIPGLVIPPDNERDGESLVIAAVREGRVDTLRLLLNRGGDANARSNTGESALHIASRSGFMPIMAALLEAGAEVSARSQSKSYRTDWSPLMMAAADNQLAAVRLLLAHEALVDATNDRGRTALSFAAFYGHTDVVTALLRAGADPARVDHVGLTPLRAAELAKQEPTLTRLRIADSATKGTP